MDSTKIPIKHLILAVAIAVVSGCSSKHLITENSPPLHIDNRAYIITTDGRQRVMKQVQVKPSGITGTQFPTGDEITLAKEEIFQIRHKSHGSGFWRGLAYGAGIGAGLGLLIDQRVDSAFTAATTFGIIGGISGFVAGHTNVYQYSDAALSQGVQDDSIFGSSLKIRNPWYFGFELTNNAGNLPFSERGTTFSQLAPIFTSGPALEAGITLNPNLLIGVKWNNVAQSLYEYTSNAEFSTNSDMNNTTLVITYFPKGSGQFARIGLGASFYDYRHSQFGVTRTHLNNDTNTINESANLIGVASTIGLGYAFWLGDHFNLTVSGNYHGQFYESERPAHLFSLTLGTMWY